jgi:hypothetical protein
MSDTEDENEFASSIGDGHAPRPARISNRTLAASKSGQPAAEASQVRACSASRRAPGELTRSGFQLRALEKLKTIIRGSSAQVTPAHIARSSRCFCSDFARVAPGGCSLRPPGPHDSPCLCRVQKHLEDASAAAPGSRTHGSASLYIALHCRPVLAAAGQSVGEDDGPSLASAAAAAADAGGRLPPKASGRLASSSIRPPAIEPTPLVCFAGKLAGV